MTCPEWRDTPPVDDDLDDELVEELRATVGDEAADRFRKIIDGDDLAAGMTNDELVTRLGADLMAVAEKALPVSPAAAVRSWVAEQLDVEPDTVAVAMGADGRAQVTIVGIELVALVVPKAVANRVARHGSPVDPDPPG